jgi:hypothetical protein
VLRDHVAGSIAIIVPLQKTTREDEVIWQTALTTHDGSLADIFGITDMGVKIKFRGCAKCAFKAFAETKARSTNFNFENKICNPSDHLRG